MSGPTLRRAGDVFVIDFGDTENRFHPDWLEQLDAALDVVAEASGPRALVTTATGKFFSNGLDLDWLAGHQDRWPGYLGSVQQLLARLLALGVPSIAAVQGHAFAGGAMLALAHDVRVMRADRGYFCLPEVDLGIPFSSGMSQLIRARLPAQVAHEAMTTGRRYGGGDALAAGIVDACAGDGEVLSVALERAGALAAKAGPTLATIKERMYRPVLTALREPDPVEIGTAPLLRSHR